MARTKSPTTAPSLPSFEEALLGLETIVEAMEHEHLALEELVSHFEKGASLLNRCDSILKSARQRIELITLRHQNEIAADLEVEIAKSPTLDEEEEDNDIRLF